MKKETNKNNCLFCSLREEDYILENELAFAKYDNYPVNKGHMLFMTKRHVCNFFETSSEERKAIFDLVDEAKKILDSRYNPDGYNIGMNCGETAGQTIMHIHVHLIPRYKGDVSNPKGGVRGVIPSKQKY